METCCNERSKYGTFVSRIAWISSSERSDGYRYSSRVRATRSVTARTSGTIEPAPSSSGRSLPYEARSWAMRMISSAASSSTSPRIEAMSRERCGPRKLGMAQNPHERSHPSAIFTYAHGEVERGRGRFNRSRLGTGGPAVTESGLRPSVTGTPNPATWSTSGSASASSDPYRSAIQPVTTRRAPLLRRSSRAKIVSIDSLRASSMKAQVFTTTRSAPSGSSVATMPSASSVPISFSESTWFLGQPRVST